MEFSTTVYVLLLVLAIKQIGVDAFIANIHYIKDTTGEAVCMDGSKPAYYLRNGSPSNNKWIVFFEGLQYKYI